MQDNQHQRHEAEHTVKNSRDDERQAAAFKPVMHQGIEERHAATNGPQDPCTQRDSLAVFRQAQRYQLRKKSQQRKEYRQPLKDIGDVYQFDIVHSRY
ncbi:MAG: hypothetical protein M3436_17880 [Pseudomonadota bacterium]|nr:hypothetical protein [Pseudomonadota bacterium]